MSRSLEITAELIPEQRCSSRYLMPEISDFILEVLFSQLLITFSVVGKLNVLPLRFLVVPPL